MIYDYDEYDQKTMNPHIKTLLVLFALAAVIGLVILLTIITDGIFLMVLAGLGIAFLLYNMVYDVVTSW